MLAHACAVPGAAPETRDGKPTTLSRARARQSPPGEAARALAAGQLDHGRRLAEAWLGRPLDPTETWKLYKLGDAAAIAAELRALAEEARR